MASGIITELGVKEVGQLKNIPAERLLAVADVALDRLTATVKTSGGFYPKPRDYFWGPTIDGSLLPELPFEPAAPACSAHVPLMIGTCLNECMPPFFSREAETFSESELHARLTPACGADTDRFVATYRACTPR